MLRDDPASSSREPSKPCVACPQRQTCGAPCDALLQHLEPVIAPGRALPLQERDAPSLADPHGHDDDATDTWDLVVAELGASANHLADASSNRHRFVLRCVLAGRPATSIARALGVGRPTLQRVFSDAIATLRQSLAISMFRAQGQRPLHLREAIDMSKKRPTKPTDVTQPLVRESCAVDGCRRQAVAPGKTRGELQPFCAVHARLREIARREQGERQKTRLAIDALPPPDLERAAAIARAGAKPKLEPHDISPSLALAFLQRNETNRSVSTQRVREYAAIMRDGGWLETSHGITFGKDGALFDGQHRLHAIVESGCTVRMFVGTGFEPESRGGLDLGRARSMGNTLQMMDGEVGSARMVSWLRAIEVLHRRGHRRLSLHDARKAIARHRESLEWMLAHCPKGRPFNHAAVMGALAYAHMVLGPEIEPFLVGYATGARLNAGEPAMVLREYLTEQLAQRKDPGRTSQVKALRCVLAYVQRTKLDRLVVSEEGYEYLLEREAEQLGKR